MEHGRGFVLTGKAARCQIYARSLGLGALPEKNTLRI
jgi:hypothetical protein